MINKVKSMDADDFYIKGWGHEIWVHNDEDYCGKELILWRDKKCSIHYHKIKKETFYVVKGKMLVELFNQPFEVIDNDLEGTVEALKVTSDLESYASIMHVGDSLVLDPFTPHRFTGISRETRFMEFSTQHFDDDSYRIWPGDSQNG